MLDPTLIPRPSRRPEWLPEPISWLWRYLLAIVGGAKGAFLGYAIATVEMEYLPGFLLGVPIGAAVGVVGGGLLGWWIDAQGGLRRVRFTMIQLLVAVLLLAIASLVISMYVIPFLYPKVLHQESQD